MVIIVSDTNEITWELDLTSADFVISPLPGNQFARFMNEFTQERNLTSATTVIGVLLIQQIVRHMKESIWD